MANIVLVHGAYQGGWIWGLVAARLRAAGHRVFASTGDVSSRAAEYWGSNQAAFSLAAWSTTRRVESGASMPVASMPGASYGEYLRECPPPWPGAKAPPFISLRYSP